MSDGTEAARDSTSDFSWECNRCLLALRTLARQPDNAEAIKSGGLESIFEGLVSQADIPPEAEEKMRRHLKDIVDRINGEAPP
jgi:hypothetical protein